VLQTKHEGLNSLWGYAMDEMQGSQDGEQKEELVQKLNAARQAAAENQDKYLRALAESENMRKRMERLCEDRMWQQKKQLLGQFLEVSDHLEEALKYISAEEPAGAGVRITYQQLQKALQREGVQTVHTVGEEFDPSVHEAVEMMDGPGPSNTVVQEYSKGYLLDGKLLRPARVQVTRAQE